MFSPPHDQYQPLWIWPAAFGGIATSVGLFWLLNRILERFFPAKRKRYAAAMGNALLGAGAVFEPSRDLSLRCANTTSHQDDTGEPPETGGRH